LKFACTVIDAVTTIVIDSDELVTSPVQPVQVAPAAGVAVNVMTVPGRKDVPVRLMATEPLPAVLTFTL